MTQDDDVHPFRWQIRFVRAWGGLVASMMILAHQHPTAFWTCWPPLALVVFLVACWFRMGLAVSLAVVLPFWTRMLLACDLPITVVWWASLLSTIQLVHTGFDGMVVAWIFHWFWAVGLLGQSVYYGEWGSGALLLASLVLLSQRRV